jgi:hypothetical protein
VCADQSVADRLDDIDAAVIGKVRGFGDPEPGTPTNARLMTFQIEQRVKGDVRGEQIGQTERAIVVRTPLGTDCDVARPETDESTGLLLTRTVEGDWYATACSFVNPNELVAAGGAPRGGPIKVVIGAAILVLVLFWALRRLRKGARPNLPGAPQP